MTSNTQSIQLYEQQKTDRMTLAKKLAGSQLCPKHFQGKVADIAIVLHQAEVLGCDGQSALSNMHVVHGTAGYSSKFLIALANRSKVFSGPIRYKWEGSGDSLRVIASATLQSGEEISLYPVSMAMAKRAKWTSNPKYKEIPEQMLSYRAATFLIRLYCPETTMGMMTVEELHDMGHAEEAAPTFVNHTEAADELEALVAGVDEGTGEIIEVKPAAKEEPEETASEDAKDDDGPEIDKEALEDAGWKLTGELGGADL